MSIPTLSSEFVAMYPHLKFVQGSPPTGQPGHVQLDPLGRDGTVPFYAVCQLTQQVCETNSATFKSQGGDPPTIIGLLSMEPTPQFPKNCAECPILRHAQDQRYLPTEDTLEPLRIGEETD